MEPGNAQIKYKSKLKLLKRLTRQMVFENAAICDECVTVSEKLSKVNEKRKFLLKKLLQCKTDQVVDPHFVTADLASSSSRLPHSQQSLRGILSKLTDQEGAAVAKAMDWNRRKQIAKLKEKVKKRYAKKKTVKEVLEEKQQSSLGRNEEPIEINLVNDVVEASAEEPSGERAASESDIVE